MKRKIIFMFLIVLLTGMAGCKYNWVLPEATIDPNPGGEPISFATQVQPIFDSKCASCHKPGATKPDLTAANSYSQVSAGYINTGKPEESKIYSFPAPSTSVHTWKKYSSNEANIVLTWIKEGAKNN